MAAKNVLNFATIFKRSSCINAVNESTKVDSTKLFENVQHYLDESKDKVRYGLRESIKSYMNSLQDRDNATDNYYHIFQIVESLNSIDSLLADATVQDFCKSVLPYVETVDFVKDCIRFNEYSLTEEQKNRVLESASLLEAADRVIVNHNKLSTRFNMENETNRYNSLGLKYLVDSCAAKIDTYKLKAYQKMNLVIEEVSYLLQKNGYEYNKKDLAKYALEFFLVENPYVSKTDLLNFGKTLTENYLLSEDDAAPALAIIDSDFKDNIIDSISNIISRYLISTEEKNYDNFCETIEHLIKVASIDDITNNFEKVIYFVWDIAKAEIIENLDVLSIFKIIYDDIYSRVAISSDFSVKSDLILVKEDIQKIIDITIITVKNINNFGNADSFYAKYAADFNLALNWFLNSMENIKVALYSSNNIDNMNYVNSDDKGVLGFNEYARLRFHTFKKAAVDLDKFIKVKESRLDNEVSNSILEVNGFYIDEINETEFTRKKLLIESIGSDNRPEITVRQYFVSESSSKLISFVENICNEFNDVLQATSVTNCKSYYVALEGLVEIRIKDRFELAINENDQKAVDESIDNSMLGCLAMLAKVEDQLSVLESSHTKSIEEALSSLSEYKDIDEEIFGYIVEALRYTGVDKSTVKLFASKFNDYQFNKALTEGVINDKYNELAYQELRVNKESEEWEPIPNVPYNLQLEAVGYLTALFENLSINESMADDWDWDDDEDDEDEEDSKKSDKKDEPDKKKSEKKTEKQEDKENKEKLRQDPKYNKDAEDVKGGYKPKKQRSRISLTGIKLGIKGLATKFKDFNQKQKEISRNVDNATRAFVKAMKDSLVSDRREDIIKGRLIPSFSRCIKSLIGLTLLGVATGNIAVPIIAAIGGLAISKKLNDKERLLLLDEIETELEVVEKELQMAESNNQMNKYRALLQYKKELQRQYQRIRYNIRVGKDILPGSSNGVKTPNV